MATRVLNGYETDALDLIERFEAVSSADLFGPVNDHLPRHLSRVLDIGAGTGRDAAWFAAQGHEVVAVEPVDAFRIAGQGRHTSPRISWIKDRLPDLSKTIAFGVTYDFVVVSAVWQHLRAPARRTAFPVLRKLTSDGGKLVMSLRHGRGARSRPVFPAKVSETKVLAAQNGFSKQFETTLPSAQLQNRERGVTWTWLVFQASCGGHRGRPS